MANSVIEIEFLRDFIIGDNLWITIDDNGSSVGGQWTWVATRSAGFEVTTGTPTGTTGEISATDFETAFDLDLPGYTIVQSTNTLTITAPTSGITFLGAKAGTGGTGQADYANFTITNESTDVDISNVQFALVRSPHYVNTPFNFETTTSLTINLFVWNGLLSAIPSEATYTLTKVRPSVDYEEFNTDLSNLVSDQIDGIPPIDLTNPTNITDSNDEEVKWFKWVASYTDPEETIPDIENTLIATDGFGYYLEGVNPTKPSTNILTNTLLRKVDRTGFILLPFFNNGTITSIDIDSNGGEINANQVITATDDSNKAVQYLSVDVSQTTSDTSITVTFNPGGQTVDYVIEDECRYTPLKVLFRNKFGVYETMTLFKKRNNTLNITNDDFTNAYISAGTYLTTSHQRQKINIQGTETISVQSGYVNEQENELYKEALLSDRVFFFENNELVPVNIKSSSLEFKTRVNDRLVNYQIEFEYAFNVIQNV